MRVFVSFAIVFLLSSCGFNQKPASVINSSSEGSALTLHKSIWKIQSNSSKRSGTCFFIESNKCVTSLSVIEEILENTDDLSRLVLSQDGSSKQIQVNKILKVSLLHNLALVESLQLVENHLSKFGNNIPKRNESIYVLGYPRDSLEKISKTKNLETIPLLKDIFIFASNHVNSSGGLDGSPVFDSRDHVVGVMISNDSNILYVKSIDFLNKIVLGREGRDCSVSSIQSCLEKQRELIKKSAQNNNISSLYYIGQTYFQEGELDQAIPFLEEITDKKEHPLAQFYLGIIYKDKEEWDKAENMLRKAAAQKYSPALHYLVDVYLEKSKEESSSYLAHTFSLLKKAAEQGYAPSQERLGTQYKKQGKLEQAEALLKQAAEQDHALAQYNLGILYKEQGSLEQAKAFL